MYRPCFSIVTAISSSYLFHRNIAILEGKTNALKLHNHDVIWENLSHGEICNFCVLFIKLMRSLCSFLHDSRMSWVTLPGSSKNQLTSFWETNHYKAWFFQNAYQIHVCDTARTPTKWHPQHVSIPEIVIFLKLKNNVSVHLAPDGDRSRYFSRDSFEISAIHETTWLLILCNSAWERSFNGKT